MSSTASWAPPPVSAGSHSAIRVPPAPSSTPTTATPCVCWPTRSRAASTPTLEVAKSAMHASMPPGSNWPEFREH